MEAITKTRQVGGSLMVTLPSALVEASGLMENQMVKISVEKIKISGFGMTKGKTPFSKEDKFRGQLEK